MLLCTRWSRSRGCREGFDEFALFLATFEPRDEFETLKECEIGDGAIAEGLGFADVCWDGVFTVLPREEDGAQVDWGAVGLVEAGGGGERVGLRGGVGEEEVGGGLEGDGGGGSRGGRGGSV